LYAVVGFALLNSRLGALEEAYQLFCLVDRYPLVHNSRWIGDVFGRPIASAAAEISASRREELEAQSGRRDLWEVAEGLLEAGGPKMPGAIENVGRPPGRGGCAAARAGSSDVADRPIDTG
jgi:hypothetical protein